MKTVLLLLLYILCLGCSTQPAVEKVQTTSPAADLSPQIATVATPVSSPTPEQLPVPTGSTYTANGIGAKLGIVTGTDAGTGCLRILNATLKASDEFYVVSPYEKPHQVSKLRIREKLAKSCVDDDSDSGDGEEVISRSSYYLTELVAGDDSSWWSTIAVVGTSEAPRIDHGLATAELTGKPPSEYFRQCTSNEGIHLTVWTGTPLTGNRIWHRYFYLHYDTDPNCKKRDYEGAEE